ncbi:MAG: methyltransferase domain-containing protein [Acidimicrobiia bacterium]|nr:methyltransferase domain-containing protein [Acidimicrobiia bacterium]
MDPTETYTHGHDESVLQSHRWRTVENSAAYLLPHLIPGAIVLDVGCGPGTITIDIARRVGPGLVRGIDASADVIAAATESAADVGATNVAFATGDVYALDLTDDAADVVHAHQVLQHLADPVAALREMQRVCRPGGVVAARDAVYRAMTWYPLNDGLDRWLELYCQVTEANRGEPDAGSHLLAWARAAGFSAVTTSASAWCYATPAERSWWGGLWADRISSTTLGTRAVELGLAEPGELRELAGAWRAWAEADNAWFGVLHGEILATP